MYVSFILWPVQACIDRALIELVTMDMQEGVAEQKAAQAKGYVEGVADTVSGRFNNIVGA
jgi:hypothetical protein